MTTETVAIEPADHESSVDEAAAAKAAIGRVVKAARHSLGTAVDVRLWTKKSPWIAVGLAATAGMAAAVLMRRGGSRAAVNGKSDASVAHELGANAKPAEPARGGIGAAIASSLFDLAKLGLETAIASGIRESAARRNRPHEYQKETEYQNETASSAE
jgi:hypothetical protein